MNQTLFDLEEITIRQAKHIGQLRKSSDGRWANESQKDKDEIKKYKNLCAYLFSVISWNRSAIRRLTEENCKLKAMLK